MTDIDELLNDYRDGFLRLDAALLSSIWADQQILYSPVELTKPITSKAELDRYYRNVAEIFADVEQMDVFDIYRQRHGSDSAAVYFRFRFRAHFVTGALHAVEGRASILFRRQERGWRGVHYHESLAPAWDPSLPGFASDTAPARRM